MENLGMYLDKSLYFHMSVQLLVHRASFFSIYCNKDKTVHGNMYLIFKDLLKVSTYVRTLVR